MKCQDCSHCEVNYLTSYSGDGSYQFNYCAIYPHRVVDAKVDRDCELFNKKSGEAPSNFPPYLSA